MSPRCWAWSRRLRPSSKLAGVCRLACKLRSPIPVPESRSEMGSTTGRSNPFRMILGHPGAFLGVILGLSGILVAPRPGLAQDVQADDLRLQASPVPLAAALSKPQLTGTPGSTTRCYWLATEYAAGETDLSGPQCVTNLPSLTS